MKATSGSITERTDRMKPVKVKKAVEGQTIWLDSCQSLVVEDEFDYIVILGNFLRYEVNGPNKVTIYQNYNFTCWTEISSLFLGNVVLVRGGEMKHLCVYCRSQSRFKANVITVVNPEDFVIKIDGSQIFHFVLYKDSEDWYIEKGEGVVCVLHETVIGDFFDIYNKEKLFCPEARSIMPPALAGFVKPANVGGKKTEHHFWCYLNLKEKISSVLFNGPCLRKVNFVVGHRRKTPVDPEMMLSCAANWNKNYSSGNSIINPYQSEKKGVPASQNWMYVEIPTPAIYFKEFDLSCFWAVHDYHGSSALGKVEVHELESREVSGCDVQRFMLSNLFPSGENNSVVVFVAVGDDIKKYLFLHFSKLCGNDASFKESDSFDSGFWVAEVESIEEQDLAAEGEVVSLCDIDAEQETCVYYYYGPGN